MQSLAALPGSTADLLCDLGQVTYPLCLPSVAMDKTPAPHCSPRGTERAGVVVEWKLRVVPGSQGHVPPGAGPSRGEGRLPDRPVCLLLPRPFCSAERREVWVQMVPGRASRRGWTPQLGLGADGSEAARGSLPVFSGVTVSWWPSENRGVPWLISLLGGRAASRASLTGEHPPSAHLAFLWAGQPGRPVMWH